MPNPKPITWAHFRAQIQAIVCLLPAVLDAIDAFFAVEIDHAQFDSDPMQVHGHHDAIFLKYEIQTHS